MKYTIEQLAMLITNGKAENTVTVDGGVWSVSKPNVPHEVYPIPYEIILSDLLEKYPEIIEENPALLEMYLQGGFVYLYFTPDQSLS